ncbi:ring-1,2-phenylacetyl-CoA epoxidase subunit PaaD [Alteribacillus persepolensis]|uniref:Ring-1,2-phenylacetyl-CoA epoxidase subunit PaaD n=1 Tax=Alteribacillus persepolensis TaxID=568899 RepID=A0A1G8GD50_9BACI|nr:1,2-phenylacetyl-CoA epoxidase subunit PaaD [Alteribacillus persepolensis]SDH92305.1 ring-1,2-phenylacetyl-CoA epoxidase subunit PaaD [Alteribacillus persepolensis]
MTDIQKKTEIETVLKSVDDPELPGVSVVDLGMVHGVDTDNQKVFISMIPTFAGCPALDIIEKNVREAVETVEWVEHCDVSFSFRQKWSTEAITEEGKKQLKKHGIAPPPKNYKPGEEWSVNCPYCDSPYTSMDNVFGPTACRSILYCRSCKNPFEAMKPVINYEKGVVQ